MPTPKHGSTRMKRARAWWAARIQATPGGIPCVYRPKGNPRCRGMITAGVPWDLAHDDDNPGAFLGPACWPCNRGKFRRKGRKGFARSTTITRELSDSEQRELSDSEQREQDRRERIEQRERERRARQRRIIVAGDDDVAGRS